MKIKQDPVTKLWAREDGAVCMPPCPSIYRFKYTWTYGTKQPRGYCTVKFHSKDYRVHQIVCRAFHGLAPEGRAEVDHINRIRSDNRSENLHWVSHKENQDNKDSVDKSVEKYGVRECEDRKAYMKARYKLHREGVKAYNKSYWASYSAEKKAQGLTYRKGPDGKYGWYPKAHS